MPLVCYLSHSLTFKTDLLEMEGKAPIQGASPCIHALVSLGLGFGLSLGRPILDASSVSKRSRSSSGVFGGVPAQEIPEHDIAISPSSLRRRHDTLGG